MSAFQFETTWPEIPSAIFAGRLEFLLERIVESGIASIRPAPKVGVVMRIETLPDWNCVAKSGCGILHPGASARPEIVKS